MAVCLFSHFSTFYNKAVTLCHKVLFIIMYNIFVHIFQNFPYSPNQHVAILAASLLLKYRWVGCNICFSWSLPEPHSQSCVFTLISVELCNASVLSFSSAASDSHRANTCCFTTFFTLLSRTISSNGINIYKSTFESVPDLKKNAQQYQAFLSGQNKLLGMEVLWYLMISLIFVEGGQLPNIYTVCAEGGGGSDFKWNCWGRGGVNGPEAVPISLKF